MFSSLFSQIYKSADPYYLLDYELKQFNKTLPYHSTSFRPFYIENNKWLSIVHLYQKQKLEKLR